jgi:glycosyltransferase involved in cell wall biosynthesis
LSSAESFAPTVSRHSLGWGDDDFVVVVVANPRPQKRLERLPEIIARLVARIAPRPVRLLLVGAFAERSPEAGEAIDALEEALIRSGVCDATHRAGSVLDVTAWLAIADVLVSVSAWEGLSLALLEALAAGLPAVSTDVGGATEVAAQSSGLTLLPLDADADQFAEVLARISATSSPRVSTLPASFTRFRMAVRVRRLYPAALLGLVRRSREAVWLITNNFSTGGAQSSARRLLTGLHSRGIKVRAVTVEEWPEYPTRGREELLKCGVEVLAIPPPAKGDSAIAVEEILAAMAEAPPRAVLFWNLIASYKLLLADGLLDIPVFDISPGEMFFAALEKLFESPRPGLPYLTSADYGALLAGVVVKYRGEVDRARRALGTSVHVIPNGVPLSNGMGAKRKDRLIIGTATRLSPDKRLEELFAALRIAHSDMLPYEFHIAGGVERGQKSYARELRRCARALPIRWLGELSSITPFLEQLDLFVMISEPAGCPNASLEAMAAGLPLIATDHGGAAEQVIDGITGRIVPRGDAAEFARALITLACDPAMRARFGAAGRDRIAAEFSLEQMLDRYSALIESASGRVNRAKNHLG